MAKGITSRREFLKNLTLAGLGLASAPALVGAFTEPPEKSGVAAPGEGASAFPEMRPRPQGASFVGDLKTPPCEDVRVGIIGLGNRGLGGVATDAAAPAVARRSFGLLGDILNTPFARVVAVGDSDSSRAEIAREICRTKRPGDPLPATYSGTEDAWEALCERDDIDVVYIATPREQIVPMAIYALRCGKHAFVEIVPELSVAECWELVDASELAQRHCVFLENSCFGDDELLLQSLVESDVLGELKSAEISCADEAFPTHGIGPVFRALGLNRNDAPGCLIAMEESLHSSNGENRVSLIKTQQGKIITLRRIRADALSGVRRYSLSGTQGEFSGSPAQLSLSDPERYNVLSPGRPWLNSAEFLKIRNRFRHPLQKDVGLAAAKNGFGGADYLMTYRLLDCLRKGVVPDITVYDGALWNCLGSIAGQSLAAGSVPVRIPDFTRKLS